MRVHEILIYPGLGHYGCGVYNRGNAVGSLVEVDLIDTYVQAMADELDNSAIRHRIATTRRAPGIPTAERAEGIFPHTLVVHCRMGWNEAKKVKAAHNISQVYYGPESAPLARQIAEVVGHWGGLYVFGHKTAQAISDDEDELLAVPNTWGIRLEPFQLNAPKAEEYAMRLGQLGRDVGRFLADWSREKDHNAAIKIQGYLNPRTRGLVG